jgi:hypothetical protein
MNKFLSLLALALLLSTASIAQSIVSFKAMGHDDEPIYGMIGATSFYLKISPLVEMKGSKLVLYIEPSQALIKEHSFVNVVINDRPAYRFGRKNKYRPYPGRPVGRQVPEGGDQNAANGFG